MKVKVDADIIGKEGCILDRSVASGDVVVRSEKIMGYLVDAREVSIRFASGRWIRAEHVYFPDEVEGAVEEFKKRFLTAREEAAEK